MSDLGLAIDGDERAFERLVAPNRRELRVHAYRLLGSGADADDAIQEAMLAAWRGLGGLREADALRAWLYRVTTNATLRIGRKRGPRMLTWDHAPAGDPSADLASPVDGPIWIELLATDHDGPEAVALRRESIELAWIAALQRLPATQRAALVLKDVVGWSVAEIAEALDLSIAAVNSALQRARANAPAGERAASTSNPKVDRTVVHDFVEAFERSDASAIAALLTDDVRFTMPPLPAWYDGIDAVTDFIAARVFATPWRLQRVGDVNGHPALLGDQITGQGSMRGALMVLHIRDGKVWWLATFVEPTLVAHWPRNLVRDR